MSADDSIYRDELRLRVCGLLVEDDRILLAQLHSPATEELIWTPPGGGVKFGEKLAEGLKREFLQETNLEVSVHNLLHINEFIDSPFHAVEFYFEVERQSGRLELGHDPELTWNRQLLNDLQWVSLKKLDQLAFAPESLRSKLLNWERRSDFSAFER